MRIRYILKPSLFFCFFFLLLLPFTHTYAQGRWLPGYVVSSNGDTLNGFVSFHHTHKSPLSIAFRRQRGDKRIIYKPGDIKMFSAHEEGQDLFYKSLSAEIDGSQTSLDRLSNNPAPAMAHETFFAQLLLKGKKSLYCYVNNVNNKTHYLIADENGIITDLINNRYFVGNDQITAVYSETYKKQLRTFFLDCSLINVQQINATDFTQKKIASLLNDYNKCNSLNAKPEYQYKHEKGLFNFGVIAGPGLVRLYISSAPGNSASQYQFRPGVSYNAGAFFNFIYPRPRKAWSLYNELLLSHYAMHAPNFDIVTYYVAPVTNAEIQVTSIKLVDMIRYQYPNFRYFKPFIEFGIGDSYALQLSATSYMAATSTTPPATNPIFDSRKYEQSTCEGIGATYKKYGVELKYEKGSGLSADVVAVTQTKSFHLLFTYKLR